MQDTMDVAGATVQQLRSRRNYIRERLVELKTERETLVAQRDLIKMELDSRGGAAVGQKSEGSTSDTSDYDD